LRRPDVDCLPPGRSSVSGVVVDVRMSRAPPVLSGTAHLPAGRAGHVLPRAPRRVDFRALLHRRVRSASSRFREAGARSFHGFWSPSRPRSCSLVSAVSRRSDPVAPPRPPKRHWGATSVRAGCRYRCRWLASRGF
jgi:hypothetical protein